MPRILLIGGSVVVAGGVALAVALLLRGGPAAGPKCPPTFPEFAVTPKDGRVRVAGRGLLANGAPFARGPVEINLTFMMPGCGALPFTATTDGNGRFEANSPPKDPPTCILAGGTATAKTKAGCDVEGATQGTW